MVKENEPDKYYFNYMDFAIQLIEGSERKIEFLERYFKNYLKIDEIEDSSVVFEKMRTKTLFYLILSILIEFEDDQRKRKDFKAVEDNKNDLYYLHVGHINPTKIKFLDRELIFCDPELEEVGVDLGKDTLMFFTYDKTKATLNYVNRVIDDLERENCQL